MSLIEDIDTANAEYGKAIKLWCDAVRENPPEARAKYPACAAKTQEAANGAYRAAVNLCAVLTNTVALLEPARERLKNTVGEQKEVSQEMLNRIDGYLVMLASMSKMLVVLSKGAQLP
jgi:hypothetical protein